MLLIKNFKRNNRRRQSPLSGVLLISCAIIWLGGCSPTITNTRLPYDTLKAFSLPGQELSPDRWWLTFEDNKLNALMDTALQFNLPLQTVWYRFKEAGARVEIAASEKWPEVFLELQSGLSRPEPDFVGGENTQLSLGASYEVDLWGSIRHSVEAEEHRFKAGYFDYKTAAVSLSGEITTLYFRLKASKNQLQVIDEQIATNEQVLALIRARFAGGQVSGVDILRQQQLIENTREQKIELESQIGTMENQLSVLLGRSPGKFSDVNVQLPALPPLPQTGIPLQLVNRRPDIQGAFHRLRASDRQVAVAISNQYPRLNFSLTGAIRSNTLTNLFESQAVSIAMSLLAPIFLGNRLNAEVARAEAVKHQQLHEYGQMVLNAFLEVENALIREIKLSQQIEVIEKQLTLAGQTYKQLRLEYLNGSKDYLDVLTILDQEQQLRRKLVDARLSLLEIRVALYRALAGGFETEREQDHI